MEPLGRSGDGPGALGGCVVPSGDRVDRPPQPVPTLPTGEKGRYDGLWSPFPLNPQPDDYDDYRFYQSID